jgi:hypothetical protein
MSAVVSDDEDLQDRQARRRRFDADQRAMRKLFDAHASSVFSTALLVTNDEQVAGVLTRRVFAQMWRDRSELASELEQNMAARQWLRVRVRAEGLAWRNDHHEHARGSESSDDA